VKETKTYRVAVVGCGRKASTIDDEKRWLTNYDALPCSHASAYSAHPRTVIEAAADPDEGKRLAFGQRWKVERLYSDYRRMLAEVKPDIVSVTTHAHLHAQVTIDAARAGAKGIICEKAMATSLNEADEMIEACRSAGARLLINHPRRYHPTYSAARKAIEGGEVGELRAIVGMMFNAVIHNGTHLFDMFRFFAGDARWVSGQVIPAEARQTAGPAERDPAWRDGLALQTVGGQAFDPGGAGVVGFGSGAIALAEVSTMQGFELQLLGSEGRIVIDSFASGFQLCRYESDAPQRQGGQWFQYAPKKLTQVEARSNSEPIKPPMLAAVEDLVESIETGRQPISSGEDGRAALEVGLAFHISSASGGARVDIPLADRKFRVVSR
jgi:predicted dehydrogenase